MKILIILILFVSQILAQTIYEIPFAAKGNEIELSVYNDSENDLGNVQISAIDFPNGINFVSIETEINSLNPKSEEIVSFTFDVDNEAAVMEESVLKFAITSNAQNWSKEIKIVILPTEKFELNQNYPNPFNPTTTISYAIPARNIRSTSEVLLFIYDILGRQVSKLVDDNQRPGFYKVEWNASNLSSGMYIYQLSMKNGDKTELLRKKMILMK